MTPQEQAMGQLLQVSLFKLADQFHTTLARLKKQYPCKLEELNEIGRDVEKMIDDTLEDYQKNKGDFSMADIDAIHARLIQVRAFRG